MSSFKSEFLNIMSERGFIHQGSDLEGLDAKLMEGVQSAYVGYDPTGTSLHIGHLYTIMMLHWFQAAGHKPISLMGGGTAKIPDPTLKDKTRPLLTDADIQSNITSIQRVFGRFLKYGDGPTDAMMINNDDWLAKLDYIPFLRDIGMHFTINRMLTFDSVRLRLERELPMTFIEFNYMILQGYDFLELNRRYGTVLQMGGSDQWGNIINGVELARRKDGREIFALTAPLLMTASGQKMGKTEGGAVWLNEDLFSPYQYYQYWRNVADADVPRLLKVFTTLPMAEVEKLAALGGAEINDAKKVLAFEATRLLHGEAAAQAAVETTRKTFEEGAVGADLPTFNMSRAELDANMTILDVLVRVGKAASKGEARRLVQGGGVKLNDQLVETDAHVMASAQANDDGVLKLSVGKKSHILIKLDKAV